MCSEMGVLSVLALESENSFELLERVRWRDTSFSIFESSSLETGVGSSLNLLYIVTPSMLSGSYESVLGGFKGFEFMGQTSLWNFLNWRVYGLKSYLFITAISLSKVEGIQGSRLISPILDPSGPIRLLRYYSLFWCN